MTQGTNSGGTNGHDRFRRPLFFAGLILWFLCLVPPMSQWSREYEYVGAIEYCLFGISIPALLVVGAQWRSIGVAAREPQVVDLDGGLAPPANSRWIDRLVFARGRRSGDRQSITAVIVFAVLAIFWRLSPIVDYLASHPWFEIFESLSLTAGGVYLWMDLVESPPLKPGATRPFRIGMSAVSMWVVWVLAYLGAMSNDSWYPAFIHAAGSGLSLSADQQISAAMMWLLSATAFIPVVYWNLVHWLQSEENPDDELFRLVRKEKTLGTFDPKN